jgi:PAS domain S-box-containing protein
MVNKTKILVIDDDPDLLPLTATVLSRAGHEVLEASTGKEGLEKARAHRPDVILLDVVLPDISGIEICRQIKEDKDLREMFVILTSGVQTSSEHQAKGLNLGADGFIAKPISNKELLARVQSMVRIKRTEEALQASETRYRRLFEAAQDGILILNEETGQIDDVNPFLTNMLGFTHEELTGKKLWEIGAFKNTEASKTVLAELKHKGYVRYEDLPLITKDGREIDVEFVSNVYMVNRHKVIQCNIRDITIKRMAEKELQRSQKLFHTIARVSPAGLFRTDREGQYVYVNEYWSEISGLSPEETYGEGWAKALCPADKERVLNEWHQAVQGDLPFGSEFCFQHHNGIKKWVMGKAIAERGVYGERLGYVGTITDITDRKKMEEGLRQAHDELEKRVVERTAQLVESNKSLKQEIVKRTTIGEELKKSRERLRNLTKHLQKTREQERAFLSRELHDDLGQTLTGMKMDIRWIERRLPEDSPLILERLHSIVMLIDDAILSVQRISMALRPPALDDFGLSEAIKLALTNFEKNTNITCKFISKPQQIVLNKEISIEIFRIFQEVFTNITRHADAKNVTILLQNSGDKLIMEVMDDGRGIAKKAIMNQKSIGLTGMRERAYAIEGNLTIIGIKGQGTKITLSVPLNEGKERNIKTIKRGPTKATQET